ALWCPDFPLHFECSEHSGHPRAGYFLFGSILNYATIQTRMILKASPENLLFTGFPRSSEIFFLIPS
ncbi:MAG TPA: hypothetical protein PLM73_10095, partial [Petrotogaceae bacterium]|nr:hypothetical protein [Petrotogaceae bacterium]